MEHVKLLSFYKLYDWMIEELGACTDAALIAVIYSFEENGRDCCMSYAQLAEILKVNRRKVITRISNLESAGYITVTKDSTKTNVYSVNRAMFPTSDQNGTSTSDQNGTSTSDQNGTSTSDQNGTQIENNREIKENKKRECARARGEFAEIPEHPEIRLTAAELAELKKMHFPTRCRSCLDEYLQALEDKIASGKKYPNHFRTLKGWIKTDTTKPAAGAAPAAGDPAQGSSQRSSSIDNADLAKLDKTMPGRGSCTG